MLRRAFVSLLSAAMFVAGSAHAQPREPFDLVIENGRIVDGTGAVWFEADVGIRGEKIAAVGRLQTAPAKRRIDAAGKIVAPGFIDMHSHASWSYLVDGRAASKLTQGITLEVEGEGFSVAPVNDEMIAAQMRDFERFKIKPDWRSLADFAKRIEGQGTINWATHIGTSNPRIMVIGYEDRPATPAELEQMKAIVDQAMRDGALGIYSALMYSPDRYNRTEELIEMAKVAAKHGGYYQTHPRSESDAIDASMDEIFRIAREADIPAHITHIKVAYQQNWGRMGDVVARIEAARKQGLDITADMYPYEQAAGSFTALLPPWAQEGGRPAIVARLKDRATREKIKKELETPTKEWENEYLGTKGGPAGITFVDAQGIRKLKRYEGRTVAEIAASENRDPRDVIFDIILAGDGGLTVLITGKEDIDVAIQQPWVSFGTDGYTTAPDGPLSAGLQHPRGYGTFPKIFGRYVRERGLIRLEEAVRRATSLPAQRLGLRDRGLLRESYFADVVVFDPATIIDVATYEKPHQLSRGVSHVVVNGQVVLDDGVITAARPGKFIAGPGFQP